MFKVSGGFCTLQRTLNQDHRMRKQKDTEGKLIVFQIFRTTGALEWF